MDLLFTEHSEPGKKKEKKEYEVSQRQEPLASVTVLTLPT